MNKKNVAFFSVVTLALALMALIVVTQFFTNKATNALTTGNLKAVSTFGLNNRIQEIVNTSFELESKLKGATNLPADKIRLQSLQDSVNTLGYNAYVLSSFSEGPTRARADSINNIIDTQVTISEKILAAVKNSNTQQLKLNIDSLKKLDLGNKVYKNCMQLQRELRDDLQRTLDTNTDQASKLSLFNRVLAVFSIIAILLLATIIIRRQSQQLKLIEELKEAELAALKSKNAKDEFLANMSHELRTPLNALIGFGNLLDGTDLNVKQKEYVEIIKSSGYNLLYIVNDVLDLSKIEAGKLTIAHRPFNLYDLFTRIKKMFSATIQDKGLVYNYFIDEQIPKHVVGDPDRLQQIFINLISNAIKFTTDGGIEVSAGIIWVDEEQKFYKLSFTIKDSGVGIPKDKIGTIFERFEQLEQGAQRQHGGTGLGLTIVKNLVERMGGSISVYSHVNEGSEFNFTCILEKAERVEEAVSNEVSATYSFEDYRVLVVEDNKANQVLLKHIFSKHSLIPRIIDNGQEAVNLLRKEIFDLVLMDIQMPVMDGYTAISILRRELYLKTPVIAMTAYVSEGEVQKCLEAGFSDYMAKPVDEELLVQKMAFYLKQTGKEPSAPVQQETDAAIDYNDNLDYLTSIIGDDKEVLAEILKEMRAQWLKDKTDLAAAAGQEDTEAINRLLHRMKSTFSSLGPDHSVYKIIIDKGRLLHNGQTVAADKCNSFIDEIDSLINKTLKENAKS
ncbi:ATP-binding protein [Niabella yanshanensis]|uniref:histidine kinase n=1 Tax=Niabella yanshanensis TaxID=577386 RepID=A0ABZ0WD65_9BACT|nr:ATP-binding protein [Niabella yanshanensis]WQD40607.1 ATP-binding protein [Niabella yanshanensis]